MLRNVIFGSLYIKSFSALERVLQRAEVRLDIHRMPAQNKALAARLRAGPQVVSSMALRARTVGGAQPSCKWSVLGAFPIEVRFKNSVAYKSGEVLSNA